MAETIKFSELTVPEIWSKLILRNLDDYGVMPECINKNYEGEIKYAGDTVKISQIGNVTVNTHDDDTPINYQKVDGNQQILKVDQQKNWAFVIKTIEQRQSNIKDLQTKFSNRAKQAITTEKDGYLHTLGFAGVSSKNQLGSVSVNKNNIYDFCISLYEKLADSNAIDSNGKAEDGKRPFLILPPALVSVIKLSEQATHSTQLGDDTVRKGSIMQYAGFDIKQSTLIKKSEDGFKILAGTKDGITYADQIIETKVTEDKDYFGLFVAGLYVYGAKVVQPDALSSALVKIA